MNGQISNMGDQEFIKKLIGRDPAKKPRYIRRHHCNSPRCHMRTVLAYQLTDDLETAAGEFFQVKDCIWVLEQPRLLYEKKKWFGNTVRCPVCGTVTKLLVDQPIAWEQIEAPKKEGVSNATVS